MFVCEECGAQAPRWEGRCRGCGAWGSLAQPKRANGARAPPRPEALADISTEPVQRSPTGYAELDRVLGGGLVPGSTTLVGGEPGIGKSTLLLSASARVQMRSLYVAGEEAPSQIALRARRLGIRGDGLFVLDTTDTAEIAAALEEGAGGLCVVDSIQTLRTPGVDGAPGGPAQVRAAADRLVPVARATNTALLLVGHVTKVGGLAGPRFLEHAVDTVVLFEGDRHLAVRALRAVKNRFGPTDEIGLFEMRDDGLHEVRHASRLLLADRADAGPGSVVAAVVEGRRALCVEVQALLIGHKIPAPRRRAQGVDPRRVEVLAGVVESFVKDVAHRDIFVNVVGGLTVRDTGLDLAAAAAIIGMQQHLTMEDDVVLIGEVGLRGEVRGVPRLEARLKEAKAMGFGRALVPRGAPSVKGVATKEVRFIHEVFGPWGARPGSAAEPRAQPRLDAGRDG